tara:strand:- start:25465 stop:26133 length:669 start_codon:yes stop_codon:yes gene_type:complete
MFRHIAAGVSFALLLSASPAISEDAGLVADATALDVAATEAVVTEPASLLTPEFMDSLRNVIASRVTTISLNAQNKRYAGLSQSDIDALDTQWRAETKSDSQPLIAQLMGNPLSSFLIRKKAESLGLYTEIFVFDAKGLNVGQSSVTSDYWQGDEAKYQKTFAVGRDAVLIDEPEFNDETKSMRQQVSFPIIDPETNEMVGAATVEINIDELARRGHIAHSS